MPHSGVGRATQSANRQQAQGHTSHSEPGSAAQGICREGDTAGVCPAQVAEYQTMCVAFGVNVALGSRLEPDSAPGPLPGHTLLGQLQLEGGAAPLADGHIFQRPQCPQLPSWCEEMGREDWGSSPGQGLCGLLAPLALPAPPPAAPCKASTAFGSQVGRSRGRR